MKNIKQVIVFLCLIVGGMCALFGQKVSPKQSQGERWKTGIAREVITPEVDVWMAGYASRTAPSEGKLHDLWAKALALEDVDGNRALLITMDLLSVPADFSDRLKERIGRKHGLKKSQIILSASHTHSGPVITRALKYIYPMDADQWAVVDQYTARLESKLLRLADRAMQEMQPSHIYTGNGITRFQVNRRNNKERELTPTTALNGPNDYAVPVIKIEGLDQKLMAVVFGYACHPTVLSGNRFCGDYPGFAQIELEKMYPGATAMFFQGGGADQNPLPRRAVSLALQYGKQLAIAVEQVLSEKMVQQPAKLETYYREIALPIEQPVSLDEMREMAVGDNYKARWAKGMLDDYQQNGSFIRSYPYPIAYWKIGKQSLFALGGELVVDYPLKLKELFGQDIFVMGYANDVMSYIPSETILEEGGYEGSDAHYVYGLPAKWSKQVEALIIENCKRLVDEGNGK